MEIPQGDILRDIYKIKEYLQIETEPKYCASDLFVEKAYDASQECEYSLWHSPANPIFLVLGGPDFVVQIDLCHTTGQRQV